MRSAKKEASTPVAAPKPPERPDEVEFEAACDQLAALLAQASDLPDDTPDADMAVIGRQVIIAFRRKKRALAATVDADLELEALVAAAQ